MNNIKVRTMREIKYDPIEDKHEYKAVVNEVNAMAESLVDSDIRYGRDYFVEEEKKKLLKELYDIDWKTSYEMNPEWDFI